MEVESRRLPTGRIGYFGTAMTLRLIEAIRHIGEGHASGMNRARQCDRYSHIWPGWQCTLLAICFSTVLLGQFHEPAEVLRPGQPIVRELSSMQYHYYRIDLTAGQFLNVVVDQRGIDVAFDLSNPQGQDYDFPYTDQSGLGLVRLLFVARETGSYTLEVRSWKVDSPPGFYEVRIEELRAATLADERRVHAESMARAPKIPPGEIYQHVSELAKARDRGDRVGEAELMIWLANCGRDCGAEFSGNPDPAYQQALSLVRSTGNRVAEAKTLVRLGALSKLRGQDEKSLLYYRHALALVRTLQIVDFQNSVRASGPSAQFERQLAAMEKPALEIETLTACAAIEAGRKQYVQALAQYEEALSKNPHDLMILFEVGEMYKAMGNFPKAVEFLERALPADSRDGFLPLIVSELAEIYKAMGDLPKAVEIYDRVIGADKTDFESTSYLPRRAAALWQLGYKDKAINDLQEYRRYVHPLVWDVVGPGIQCRLGFYLMGVGRDAEAKTDFEDAIKTVSHDVLVATDPQEAQEINSHMRACYDGYIRLRLKNPQARQDASVQASMFDLNESARARGLLALLAEAKVNIREGTDPQLLQRDDALTSRIRAMTTVAARVGDPGKKASSFTTMSLGPIGYDDVLPGVQNEKGLDGLFNEQEAIRRQIRASNPRYASLIPLANLSVANLQAKFLDQDTILLEYSIDDTEGRLWAISRDSMMMVGVPGRRTLESLTHRLYNSISALRSASRGRAGAGMRDRYAREIKTYREITQALSRQLLAPVAKMLTAKRLVIVADNPLHLVPFAALPAPSRNKARDEPLIAAHEIVYLPSATVLAYLRKYDAWNTEKKRTIAVIADPVFDRNDPRVVGSTERTRRSRRAGQAPLIADASLDRSLEMFHGSERGHGLPRLPFTRIEADAIRSLVPSSTYISVDFDANLQTVMGPQLSKFNILHFATHGLLNTANPSLSGLVFSLVDEAGRSRKGFLTLHDLYNIKLDAELVVLSACNSGRGAELRGEGLIGLTRGFMYAGVPRVIASLWNIDDFAGSEIMKRFYKHLLVEHEKPAAALRAAQLEMLHRREWSSPYYWAGFVMAADGK